MTNKINKLLIAAVLVSLTSISFAYEQPRQERGGRMAQELNLSAEQQEQFNSIIKEQRATAKSWRQKHHEETREKLSKILNGEQMKKLDELKDKRSKKRNMRKRDR